MLGKFGNRCPGSGGKRVRRGGGRGTLTETSSLMAGFFPNRTTQKEVRIASREAGGKFKETQSRIERFPL